MFVVSYWNSTSNHNREPYPDTGPSVVSYWNSTSNHNRSDSSSPAAWVVSYWNSTSNHNWRWTIFTTSPCCILLKFYIKPQRQALNRLIYCIIYQDYHHWKVRIHTLTKSIWCISACQRTRQIYAKYLKKLQLLRYIRFGPFDLPPEIHNITVLFVRHGKNTRISRRRHWSTHPIYMYPHILFRWTMPDINRILHHRKTILLQCLAELCGMTPLSLGIGRQIEKYK